MDDDLVEAVAAAIHIARVQYLGASGGWEDIAEAQRAATRPLAVAAISVMLGRASPNVQIH